MNKLILLIITIVFSALNTNNSFSQDVHFTMYDIMPATLNPALAGGDNGDFRAVLNYRNQWGSIGNPYKTYSFGIDAGLFKNKWKSGYLGIGLNGYNDVAGANNYGTSKINLSISSSLLLDKNNSFSVGINAGWVQNSMDRSNLQWGNQFDGQNFDPSTASNEQFTFENSDYVDFSTGATWKYNKNPKTISSKDELKIQVGIAFYHVSKPSQQLEFGEVDKLYSKWAFHTESRVGISNTKLTVIPKFLIIVQGPTLEIIAGSMFRYTLQEKSKYTGTIKGAAIAFGGYYRFGDALAPSMEIEISDFTLGIAYDITLSGLTIATTGQGGPELYIKYTNSRLLSSKR